MKTKNINKGKAGFVVTAEKYEPIKTAILKSLPGNSDGMTFSDLVANVKRKVDPSLFPKKGSVSWYTKVVQLDLESKGLVQRLGGDTPLRFRLAKSSG